jgi:glycogen debranching enzyme
VAGYRTSGITQRPGFAWFFGRDSFWATLALDAEGDFATTRTAIEFISKYQRSDGTIPHEIAQGANFVNWFTDYPYPYASVDATPLYIIATNDYVTESGDPAFAREKWDSLWKAYQFLHSTYDSQGLPQNFGLGHGWVEGGPLLPVNSEFYQSGLGAQALSALSNLAHVAGNDDVSKQLADEYSKQKQLVNQAFWSAESCTYAFALDRNNQKVIEPSVLTTVPMWFGLLDAEKAGSMIEKLAAPEHLADWGMRIISSKAPRYESTARFGLCSRDGHPLVNTATTARFRRIRICARMLCWRWMDRSGMSQKCCPATTISRFQPAPLTRFGRPRW